MGYQENGRKKSRSGRGIREVWLGVVLLVLLTAAPSGTGLAGDLDQVRKRGVLRHLGIPYARFVTGSGDGLDVELVQRFASSLGLGYEFVPTTWKGGLGDLTGKDLGSGSPVPVRGDILASGMTILPWRKERVSFSVPTFASQVWLTAGAGHPLDPIRPGRDTLEDIRQVRERVRDREVTGMAHTCLDPVLYELAEAGALIRYFEGRLNDLAPFVIDSPTTLALLDVPDALVAMEKWPGQLKIIGPVSPPQQMAAATAKGSVELRTAFDRFFQALKRRGQYREMVERYYPGYVQYFPDFFSAGDQTPGLPREERQGL